MREGLSPPRKQLRRKGGSLPRWVRKSLGSNQHLYTDKVKGPAVGEGMPRPCPGPGLETFNNSRKTQEHKGTVLGLNGLSTFGQRTLKTISLSVLLKYIGLTVWGKVLESIFKMFQNSVIFNMLRCT